MNRSACKPQHLISSGTLNGHCALPSTTTSAGLTAASHAAQGSSLHRTAGLTVTLFVVIALFLAAAQLGGSALSAIQQSFQQNVTFTQKDFVPYSERLRCAPAIADLLSVGSRMQCDTQILHAHADMQSMHTRSREAEIRARDNAEPAPALKQASIL